jgi:hypothetical protein
MTTIKKIALICATATLLCAMPVSIQVSRGSGVTATIDSAEARFARRGGFAARGGVGVRRSVAVGPRGGVAVRRTAVAVGPRGAVGVRRGVVVAGGYRPWVRRAYYGTVVGGIALGTIIAATAAPAAPADNLCWSWSNSEKTRGYWDYCTPPAN